MRHGSSNVNNEITDLSLFNNAVHNELQCQRVQCVKGSRHVFQAAITAFALKSKENQKNRTNMAGNL
jgi:hypothetical protein